MSRRRTLCALPILALVALALMVPARAEMAEALRREFHDERELGIRVLTDSTVRDLERWLADKESRILVVQVSPDRLTAERAGAILEWVREGHSAWFYDSRLAQAFGMKQFPLRPDQFKHKPESGELGDSSFQGVATVVLATGPHEVLAGVGQATVFLPELETGFYSAVEVAGDTLPLLQFAPDSPALAALRRDGRGLIVFKPLLWTKPLSGERFQRNLLEFSAGFGVPGVGGEGRVGHPPGPRAEYVVGQPAVPPAGYSSRVMASPLPSPAPGGRPATSSPAPPTAAAPPAPTPSPSPAAPVAAPSPAPSASPAATPAPAAAAFPDRVEIAGEGVIEARVLQPEFRFETTGQSLHVTTETIRSLKVESPVGLDRLVTRDGRTLSGFLLVQEVQVAVPDGIRTLEKRQLLSIEFGAER